MSLNGMVKYIDRSKLSHRCSVSGHRFCNGFRRIDSKTTVPCECDCHKEKKN